MTDPPPARLYLTFSSEPSNDSIINWESYSFDSDFLTPTDGFTFTVGDEQITPDLRSRLKGNTKVQLKLDFQDGSPPRTLCTGYAEQPDIDTSRSGSTITVRGRDILGKVCDAGADPFSNTFKFADGQTLGDVLGKVFGLFGISTIFLTDSVNRSIITGIDKSKAKLQEQEIQVTRLVDILSDNPHEETTTQTVDVWVDPTAPTDLTDLKVKQLKPEVGETCYEFAERVAKRFHLHIWAMADGSGVVVSKPEYQAEPIYTFTNRFDGKGNNIIHSTVTFDGNHAPNVIIAKGFQGGGDFTTTRIKCAMVNEFLGYAVPGQLVPAIQDLLNTYKGLTPETPRDDLIRNYSGYFEQLNLAIPLFLEDTNSKTLAQLRSAVQRKMSEFQRNALTIRITVQDHHQDHTVYRFNEIASVQDETLGINGNFWISRVTFKQSRGSGTTTDLTLIPINTILL